MASTSSNIHEVEEVISSRKRSRSDAESSEDETVKRSCQGLTQMFASSQGSASLSSSGERILQLQEEETDYPQNTSFSDISSAHGSTELEESEYEPVIYISTPVTSISEPSSGNEDLQPIETVVAIIGDGTYERPLSDREDESDINTKEKITLESAKWPSCYKCNKFNDNPSFQFCRNCYRKKMELFPPRPRAFKKRPDLQDRRKNNHLEIDPHPIIIISSGEEDHEELENHKRLKIDTSLTSCNNNLPDSQAKENDKIPENHKEGDESMDCDELNTSKENILSSTEKSDQALDTGTEKTVEAQDTDTEKTEKKAQDTSTEKTEEVPSTSIEKTEEQDSGNDSKELDTTPKKNGKGSQADSEISREFCIICTTAKRDSIFLHGRKSHLACCYPCAVKTWKVTKCCPICKAKVTNVIKIYS